MLAHIFDRFKAPVLPIDDPRYQAAAACLHELSRRHAFIDLRSTSGVHQVRSMILSVAPMDGDFLIDQPFPPEQEAYLVAGQAFRFSSTLPDGPVQFETRILNRIEEPQGFSFRCAIPPEIDRNQRRQNFRLAVEAGDGIQASLRDGEEPAETAAEVLNLSAAGIRVRVPQKDQWLVPERCRPQCRLNLGRRCSIRCNLVMRNVEVDEDLPAHWRLGASFAGLDRYQQRQLGGYIAERQRQQLRGAA